MNIVAVHDRAANGYSKPFYVQHLAQATRSFKDEINRDGPDNHMYRYPDDYNLYHLGYYDEDHGTFENLPHPQKIADGKQLKEQRNV